MNRSMRLPVVLLLVLVGTEANALGAEPPKFKALHSARYHIVPIETQLQHRLTNPRADVFIALDGSKPLDDLLADASFHAGLRAAAATRQFAFVFIFAPSRAVVHSHPESAVPNLQRLITDMGFQQAKVQWSTTTCNGEGIWDRPHRLLAHDAALQPPSPETPQERAEIRLWPVQSSLSKLLTHDAKWFIETTGERPLPGDYSADLAKALKDQGVQTTSAIRLAARQLSGQAQADDFQIMEAWRTMIRSLGYMNAEVVY